MGLFAALVLASQSGCLAVAAGAAAGVAGAAYYHGAKRGVFSADFDTVWRATREALLDLHMPIYKESRSANAGTMQVMNSRKETITIDVEHEPARLPSDAAYTRVKIRVGVWGDEAASARIFDHIDYWVQRYQQAGW